MKKKKIIHVVQSAGGVAEYLYMFFQNMTDNGYHHILVVSEDYKEQIQRFENLVNKVYIVPMKREISLKFDVMAIRKLKTIFKQESPDIVYLHSSKAGAIGRIALLFNHKIKILYNAHGWYFNADMKERKKKIFAFIEKILAIKTDKIINISKDEYQSAVKYRIANTKKMCVIENGIDFKKFEHSEKYRDETRKKYEIKEEEKVIGVVGRLTEQKDSITAIKSFDLIHKNNKETKFMFIGSGELQKDVQEYARQNNIENDMIITGWVKDVEKYIPALDVAILPSRWEGFGFAIVEYMACDKPIVASDVGGIRNLIKHGENGFLTTCGDAESIAKYVEKILLDDKIRDCMIKKNQEDRQKYNIQNVVHEHLKVFGGLE